MTGLVQPVGLVEGSFLSFARPFIVGHPFIPKSLCANEFILSWGVGGINRLKNAADTLSLQWRTQPQNQFIMNAWQPINSEANLGVSGAVDLHLSG